MMIDSAMAKAFEGYQNARSEIGALQAEEGKSPIDIAALETAIRAYELESIMRGLGLRIQSGKSPDPKSREHFDGAYRFYLDARFPEIENRLKVTRPNIAFYLQTVIDLEFAMGRFLDAAQ